MIRTKINENEQIALESIICDGRFQIRSTLNQEVVEDYTRTYAVAEGSMPPLVVWRANNGQVYVVCGHHRHAAATAAGVASLECEVLTGDERSARLIALRDNRKNGLRMTNEDKRHAVEIMLGDPEWKDWSDRKIADTIGVDGKTVAAHRKKLSAEIPQIEPDEEVPVTRKVERNGTVYEMKVPVKQPVDDDNDWPVQPTPKEHNAFLDGDELDAAIAEADRLHDVGYGLIKDLDDFARRIRAVIEREPVLKGDRAIIDDLIGKLRVRLKATTGAHVCHQCEGHGCRGCLNGVVPHLSPSAYPNGEANAMCERVAGRTGKQASEIIGWKG